MNRRETLLRMIDQTQAKADRAQARGQWVTSAKHLAKVGRLLAEYDAQ